MSGADAVPPSGWRGWARRLRRETMALYFAARDPRVKWPAKLLAAMIVAYALSPIDLIPDFIPVLGLLDELVILPAGVAIALRMIPPVVIAECRERAAVAVEKPVSWTAAAIVVAIWIALALWAAVWLL